MNEHRVPVVEMIFDSVTNLAVGAEIDSITGFEHLAVGQADATTTIALSD